MVTTVRYTFIIIQFYLAINLEKKGPKTHLLYLYNYTRVQWNSIAPLFGLTCKAANEIRMNFSHYGCGCASVCACVVTETACGAKNLH